MNYPPNCFYPLPTLLKLPFSPPEPVSLVAFLRVNSSSPPHKTGSFPPPFFQSSFSFSSFPPPPLCLDSYYVSLSVLLHILDSLLWVNGPAYSRFTNVLSPYLLAPGRPRPRPNISYFAILSFSRVPPNSYLDFFPRFPPSV